MDTHEMCLEDAERFLAERDQLQVEIERLRAQANCGEGHDPKQICCYHTAKVKQLRAAADTARSYLRNRTTADLQRMYAAIEALDGASPAP